MLQVPGERTWSRFFPTAAMSGSLGSCEFTVNALQLAQDHRQLFRRELHNQGHAPQLSSRCVTALRHYTVSHITKCSALTAKQPYLLCSNHQCHIDTPLWSHTLLQALNRYSGFGAL